jgi:hypothetical protein
MKADEVQRRTKEAVDYLVESLKSGRSEVLVQSCRHGTVPPFQFRERDADCQAESSDMLLYLAGVNEHAALRIVGSKRWRVSHLLRTIQFFSTMEFTS